MASTSKAERRKFARGDGLPVATRKVQDRKLRGQLRQEERLATNAQESAAGVNRWLAGEDAGGLEPEGELEETWRLKQDDIVRHVEVGAAAKRFDLNLPEAGPYSMGYSRDGRWLLLGGRRGHLAMLDWSRGKLVCEVSAPSPAISHHQHPRKPTHTHTHTHMLTRTLLP